MAYHQIHRPTYQEDITQGGNLGAISEFYLPHLLSQSNLRSWIISPCLSTLQHKLRNLRRWNNFKILLNEYFPSPSNIQLKKKRERERKNIQLLWASRVCPTLCVHIKSDNPPWQLKDQINQGVNYTDHFLVSHGHKGYRWLHVYATTVKNSTTAFISMNSFDYMFIRCTKGLHKTLSLLVQIFWLLKSF